MKKVFVYIAVGALFFFASRWMLDGANDLKVTNLAVALLIGCYAAKSAT